MKRIGILFLTLTLLLLSFSISVYAKDSEPVNYVALGDSIAAGTGTGADVGYPELFSAYLEQKFGAVNFNDYSKDGMTSSDLLVLLMDENVMYEIKSADVITLTIGGNDFLQPILTPGSKPSDIENYDIGGIITNYSFNLASILGKIKCMNSDVVIYVTNLYNPFQERYTPPELYPLLDYAIVGLNQATQITLTNPLLTGCVLVDIYSRFSLYDHTKNKVLWRLPEEFWLLPEVPDNLPPYLHPTDKGQSLIFKEVRASLKYKDLVKAIK